MPVLAAGEGLFADDAFEGFLLALPAAPPGPFLLNGETYEPGFGFSPRRELFL